VDQTRVKWRNRAHFFAIAAQAMRRILVDHARAKHRDKRGGDLEEVAFEDAASFAAEGRSVDLVALDEALIKLAEMDEQKARIVELRYFSGLSVKETAEVMDISTNTVERHWTMSKAWLLRELTT
jgi:RNA polymerase sigma factor (TIGR02999 family)